MSPDEIQSRLSELFCPPLDTTLVAAIAHEPGQTLQSAKEVCETLAAAALPDTDTTADSPPLPETTRNGDKFNQTSTAPATGSVARRRAFGGKLTRADGTDTVDTSASRGSTTTGSTDSTIATPSTTPSSPHTTAADAATVERLLHEWSLVDKSSLDPDNLHLTDEEAGVSDGEEQPGHRLLSTHEGAAGKLVDLESEEAERVGALAGAGEVDPTALAKGEASLNGGKRFVDKDTFDPVVFLQHAFPSRTVQFLRETLDDSHGDVQPTVDTIMTIGLIEAEDARSATAAQVSDSGTSTPRKVGGGLDYEALAHGLSTNGAEDSNLRGKKRRAARKRLQQEQRSFADGLAPTAADSKQKGKLTVNLTDVRHGGASSNLLKKVQQQQQPAKSRSASPLPRLTDEQLAAKLAAEEEEAARDPDADRPVSDNQWLLTSSVLSQLSTLLDIEPIKVTSVYNASSFNLAVCFARLLEQESDKYPSLTDLDEAGDAPPGTAERIANGIAAIGSTTPATASKALRATKGRQDAALDLMQLQLLVEREVGEADALDPMGRLKELGAAEVPKSVEASARGYAIDAAAGEGQFARTFPTPSQAALAKSTAGTGSGGVYSNIVGRKTPGPVSGAAAALRSGSAVASVFPASSAFVGGAASDDLFDDPVAAERGLASHTSHYDPMRRMTEYRLVAEEYRLRRDEALRKAASAWKSQRGGVRSGGKGGDGGRGGIAWHYADEARRLDAKSRAWSLRASQALVEDRRRAAVGVVRPGTQPTASHNVASNTIDLHGVTVHEALSIVREQVTKWYSRPGPGLNPPPFKIVTGVGRHSPHQIAVLRPAIAKMLDREGWRYDVDHSRGVIVVRGTK
ncbi:Smr protein/MutS2 C-terminal [Kalmanozyma brasiliensis GHG001]|uniref:Smr domain-containing protein n=1 Tax=Kalmanozyma brasiliensis (strain GHG001) TaxID=1365824 RepID=V5GUY3_KALBG|nr:Smr protein/MutS2 C-terminal [Kalmanozyma brasiliensis GHG001]EST09722.1 Smr protein/MutS2 C-terminal [Kalmanozyma brasiliensis GHG001]